MNEIISASLEDYLEAVFLLSECRESVRVTDIAAFLEISKPSVHKAMGALAEKGYISHESYKGIALTEKGKEKAVEVLNRHRLLKNFLTVHLGVSEETAEKDACRMEHVISSETAEKLLEYINFSNESEGLRN